MSGPTCKEDDQVLMLQVREGHARPFAILYHRHSPFLRTFIRRRCASCKAHDQEEVLQEVFLRVWRGRSRYQPTASVRTWLVAITQHVLWEIRRQPQAPESLRTEPTGLDSVHQTLARTDQAQIVQAAISLLSPKQRQAVELVYGESLAPTKAAVRANCDPKVMGQRLVDARRRLREMLRTIDGDR